LLRLAGIVMVTEKSGGGADGKVVDTGGEGTWISVGTC
jgi:hypothetical protein